MDFTIVFRIPRYSNISLYYHLTLVHILGHTSLKTLVADSKIWQKFELNPMKYSISPICTGFFLGKIKKKLRQKISANFCTMEISGKIL